MKKYKNVLIESMIGDDDKVEVVMNVAAGVIMRLDENNTKQILLIQRAPDDHWPHHWEFPRGKCDKPIGESLLKCCAREIKEETGLDIEVLTLIDKFEYLADHGKRRSICHNFLCRMKNPDQKIKLSFEHQDYHWISEVGEAELMVMPDQKRTIEKVLNRDRTIAVNPDNDFTDNNTQLESYYEKPMTKIEVLVRDHEDQLVKMIEHIRILAAPGHSFEVVVDPSVTKDEGKESFFMDGDGAFFIKEIKKNGKKVNIKDGKLIEGYLKKIQ